VSRRVWEAVEIKARKVRIAETEERGKKGRRRKKARRKKAKERERKEEKKT